MQPIWQVRNDTLSVRLTIADCGPKAGVTFAQRYCGSAGISIISQPPSQISPTLTDGSISTTTGGSSSSLSITSVMLSTGTQSRTEEMPSTLQSPSASTTRPALPPTRTQSTGIGRRPQSRFLKRTMGVTMLCWHYWGWLH